MIIHLNNIETSIVVTALGFLEQFIRTGSSLDPAAAAVLESITGVPAIKHADSMGALRLRIVSGVPPLDMATVCLVRDMVRAHVEDIRQGLEDHMYDPSANLDFPDKRKAMQLFDRFCAHVRVNTERSGWLSKLPWKRGSVQ